MNTVRPIRRRSVPHSFEDQVTAWTARLEQQAESMAPGPARDDVEARIRELKMAVQMAAWLRLPAIAANETSDGLRQLPLWDEHCDLN